MNALRGLVPLLLLFPSSSCILIYLFFASIDPIFKGANCGGENALTRAVKRVGRDGAIPREHIMAPHPSQLAHLVSLECVFVFSWT